MYLHARIIIYLEADERKALFGLANTEKRDPRQQAAYLIRAQLKHLGLLKPAQEKLEVQMLTDKKIAAVGALPTAAQEKQGIGSQGTTSEYISEKEKSKHKN